MKTIVTIILCFINSVLLAQQTSWSTELQSEFIDITGLFGVEEVSSVNTVHYSKKNFGVEVYHAFSLEKPGRTAQSYFSLEHKINFDSAKRFYLLIKPELAYSGPAQTSFIRPRTFVGWNINKRNKLLLGAWIFRDTRDQETEINGTTALVAYIHTIPIAKFLVALDTRLLYLTIYDGLEVHGLIEQAKFTYTPWQTFVALNGGYSFYRSDDADPWIWNIAIGKTF